MRFVPLTLETAAMECWFCPAVRNSNPALAEFNFVGCHMSGVQESDNVTQSFTMGKRRYGIRLSYKRFEQQNFSL